MNVDIVNKNNNKVKFAINPKVYNIKIVMKASYIFIDEFYIFLDYQNGKILVTIESKNNNTVDIDKCKGEFCNELLRQGIRYAISMDTKDIRELIMGKALYDTCIEYESNKEVCEENQQFDDYLNILTNWFDRDGNTNAEKKI